MVLPVCGVHFDVEGGVSSEQGGCTVCRGGQKLASFFVADLQVSGTPYILALPQGYSKRGAVQRGYLAIVWRKTAGSIYLVVPWTSVPEAVIFRELVEVKLVAECFLSKHGRIETGVWCYGSSSGRLRGQSLLVVRKRLASSASVQM